MITIKGVIEEREIRDGDMAIHIDSDEPLAEFLEDKIKGRIVNVKYFIANVPETKAVLVENLIKTLYGDADVKYLEVYSEYTGYLWTDEDLNIGGHDLLAELKQNIGKFLYLEIDVL